jgi:hypothetical protein
MARVLVVGCSFFSTLECDNPNIRIIGIPGAGNRLIAEIVIHELANNSYDKVYVVWSGINRLDIPIGIDLHTTISNDDYLFLHRLNHTVWYMSGGIDAAGSSPACPSEIQKLFRTQYIGATPQYLTNLTLSSIISAQSLLTAKQIPYRMSFIYDVNNQIYDNSWLSNVLGAIDWSEPLHKLIDWYKIQTDNTPYEWCKSRNLLTEDNFHPSVDGMTEWLLENFELDIARLLK